MTMHLETKDRQAFDKLREAQLSLSLFERSKQRSELQNARDKLKEALDIDPQYLRAVYYRGLIRDMLGEAKEAVVDFKLVLDQRPPFLPEVKYNLGVATFHQYGNKNLDEAIKQFTDVIDSTRNPALRLRAGAFMAHAYAVMMIPKLDVKTDDCEKVNEFLGSESARKHVSKYYHLSKDQSEKLAAELKTDKRLDQRTAVEITWRLCNTRAVQRMFYTDYFDGKRVEKLREAEEALLEADNLNPNNWSIYCNLGSTYMRLGHWIKTDRKDAKTAQEAEVYFGKAIERLDKVIDELLPNYGFALYEKGRVYRLKENFAAAKDWLSKAWEIKKNRAVSDGTLKCELERAKAESTDYPFLRPDRS